MKQKLSIFPTNHEQIILGPSQRLFCFILFSHCKAGRHGQEGNFCANHLQQLMLA